MGHGNVTSRPPFQEIMAGRPTNQSTDHPTIQPTDRPTHGHKVSYSSNNEKERERAEGRESDEVERVRGKAFNFGPDNILKMFIVEKFKLKDAQIFISLHSGTP